MKKLINILGLTLLCYGMGSAQSGLSFQQANELSLAYFQKKSWNKLIELGELAEIRGLDFYALQYRLGVAYYKKNNYLEASRHFENTLTFNSGDIYALEYLYYSYLFSGRERDARLLSKDFVPALKKKMGLESPRIFDFLYTEGGVKASSLPDSMSNMFYGSTGLRHILSPTIDVYHSFSFLKQDYFDVDFNQYQYYLSSNFQLAKGWTLSPAIHILGMKGQNQYNETIESIRYEITSQKKENDQAYFLGISYSSGRFTFSPYASILRIKFEDTYLTKVLGPFGPIPNQTQEDTYDYNYDVYQYGLNATIVPPILENRIHLLGEVALHDKLGEQTILWKVGAGIQVNPKLAFQATYVKHGVTDFLENNASVFNNATSNMQNRFSLLGSFALSPRLTLYTVFQREQKLENDLDFHFTNFITGLKINL